MIYVVLQQWQPEIVCRDCTWRLKNVHRF